MVRLLCVYDKRQISELCTSNNYITAGSEGLVFSDRCKELVAKRRLLCHIDVNPGKIIERDELDRYCKIEPLAERIRYYIHGITNCIIEDLKSSKNPELSQLQKEVADFSLVRIFQATSEPKNSTSVSVMPLISGTRASHAEFPVSTNNINRIFSFLNNCGIELDLISNKNCILTSQGKLVFLETLGGVHPEILKLVPQLSTTARERVLRGLAKLVLLGGVEPYPTIRAVPSARGDGNEDRFQIWPEICAKAALDSSYSHIEYEKALQFFGGQFKPERFDWHSQSAAENYGISSEVFCELKKYCDIYQDAMQKVLQAQRESKASDSAGLVERVRILNGVEKFFPNHWYSVVNQF